MALAGISGDYGWVTHAAMSQDERSIAGQVKSTGPKPLPHLSRTLYVPRHDTNTPHITVQDISAQYATAVGQLPIGSNPYVVALVAMQKPSHINGDAAMAYEVDYTTSGEAATTVVRPRLASVEVEIAATTGDDNKAATLTMKKNGIYANDFPISISYPIPPSQTREGIFAHPYFTFKPESGETATLEWQIHPTRDGRMRYTLVRIQSPDSVDKFGKGTDGDILAIYHHVGVVASLSVPHSEGVLLLPQDMGPEMEGVVVGSTLAMLKQLRDLGGESKGKWLKGNGGESKRCSFKGLFKR